MLHSINPFTGETFAEYSEDTSKKIQEKLAAAKVATKEWKNIGIKKRAVFLKKLAEYIRSNIETMAKMATDEMGKPITQSHYELEKCAFTLNYFAEQSESIMKPIAIKGEVKESFVCFEPLGTVLAIMPWNFPYWQAFRAMSAILISGNTMVLKHASNVTGCGIEIEKAMNACGFPKGVFELLKIKSSAVEAVISDERIHAVTFTGSTDAGRKVAAAAGANLKKQVLELGGSDAYVILKDADLELAAEICATSRLNNSGQSCIAAKRMIVEESVAPHFERLLMEAFEKRPFGDPSDEETSVGTMARMDLRDELHKQVEASIAAGASLLCGGYIPDGEAAFYPPTILTKVTKGMPAYHEELFGPVASIIIAKDEDEAIEIANDSPFGLGGAVFTKDLKKGKEIASHRMEAGSVFVNSLVSSNAKFPFGGIKQSGYGRELSYFGVHEFVNIKTVSIK